MNSRKQKSINAASSAGLIYISHHIPGITRKRSGKGYAYYLPNGNLITDKSEKNRINSLGIPPAYTNVWISPIRNSHLQATGRDKRSRLQYKYHSDWRDYKNISNHKRMIDFGHHLARIRHQVDRDIASTDIDLHKSQVVATVIKLLDITLIRVGNIKYAKTNDTYGLTTLRKKHISLNPETDFKFEFQGKSHKDHRIEVSNKKLFQIVSKCMDIPGYELFKYFDYNGKKHDITSTDINIYLHKITGDKFTAKDFRTWWATVLTLMTLENTGYENTNSKQKEKITKAIIYTSKKLGNTPSVCRKYYIYPGVLDAYLDNTLPQIINKFDKNHGLINLSVAERKALHFLEHHTAKK